MAYVHALAAVAALSGSLKITLDALADMYERRDGPWYDELVEAALNGPAAQAGVEDVRESLKVFFLDYRRTLERTSV